MDTKTTPFTGATIAMALGLLGATASAHAQEPVAVGVTATHSEQSTVRPAPGGAPEDVGPARLRTPIDVRRYLPMPLPTSVDELTQARGVTENRLVTMDLRDRTVTLGAARTTLRGAGAETFTSGASGDPTLGLQPAADAGEEDQPLNFSTLSLVSNPELYPWRVAVKLFMTFRDTTGTARYYVCSGSLIDSSHVITAGHCVYSHTDSTNGWVFNDWAEEITVVPGYENGSQPYGDARATQLHSWTGWTVSANFDHDIGIIDLDRPIGALAGWHGYGWFGGCGSFTGGSFRHAGYPAASPFSGQFLYTNTGSYDSCETDIFGNWYGNEVRFNRQSWGGQSGSGSYEPQGSCPSCWVRAVLSNGTSSYTDDVRITEGKFNDIGSFISADTPSSLDLVPLDVNASPGSLFGGTQLSAMDYLVHNASSASWSGTVNVEVYLSTNAFISTADTLIQTHNFTWSFTPKSSVRITVTVPPTIPASMPTGNYYVGILLDIADANTANNPSHGQDAFPIHIDGAPDLVVESPGSSQSTVYLGETTLLTATVRNAGVGNSSATTLRYRQSSNSIISSADPQIGTDPVVALVPSATSPESYFWTPPNTGVYWIGACVNTVPGESNTSNQCSTGVPFTVAPPWDLLLQSVTLTGIKTEDACNSVTAGAGTSVASGATVIFRAPTRLVLRNGFLVRNGATFTMRLAKPALCP